MSGDSGGIIAALVLAPVALGAAAMAGLAYGTFKVGSVLVKAAYNYAKKKSAEKALAVNNCSRDLENLYSQMQASVLDQARAFESLSLKTQKQLDLAAAQLQQQAQNAPAANLTALNNTISKAQADMEQNMAQHAEAVKKSIIEPGRKQLLECQKAVDDATATKRALVDWKKKDALAQANQRALAQDSIRDAKASIALMENLGKDLFAGQYGALKASLEAAQADFDAEMYESAFSASRTVIREVAIQVAQQQAAQLEADMASMQLQARYEGLMEQLKQRRYITIPNEDTCEEPLVEDLDEFSQGKYAQLQQDLEKKLQEVRSCTTVRTVQAMEREFEDTVLPRATKIVETAQQVMQGYHEELRVLDVVEEFMESQNYTMDWIAPVNDDLSQKIVAHFVNRSGNAISFTMENGATAEQVVKMVMEMLFYYDGREVVSEREKKHMRDGLNAALKRAGIQGGVDCQGQVNQPASDAAMNSEEAVLNQAPRTIL